MFATRRGAARVLARGSTPKRIVASADTPTFRFARRRKEAGSNERLGTALRRFHCCIIDDVLAADEDGPIRCAEVAALSVDDVAAVQQQLQSHVLRWFVRAGYFDASAALDLAGWEHGGGFSLDASVRIEAPDRAGLERLLRYCARPPFALDRLQQRHADQLVYRLSKPRLDGCTALRLAPLELIDRLAALIPPPRRLGSPRCVRMALIASGSQYLQLSFG